MKTYIQEKIYGWTNQRYDSYRMWVSQSNRFGLDECMFVEYFYETDSFLFFPHAQATGQLVTEEQALFILYHTDEYLMELVL